MTEFHEIWLEQCEAARDIREAFGVQKAIGYLIGEKLLDFLRAADQDPAFAGELPRFVEEIKRIFDRAEIQTYLDSVHRVGPLGHVASDEAYEEMREAGAIPEDPVWWAEEILLIERAKRLLLAGIALRSPGRRFTGVGCDRASRRREGDAALRQRDRRGRRHMPKQLVLKPGAVVWVPCELKTGIFPTEQGVKIEVDIGEPETIFGFVPKEDIKQGATAGHGLVRAVVLDSINGKVAVLFRGDILSQSNPIIVPLEWLEEVGQPEA